MDCKRRSSLSSRRSSTGQGASGSSTQMTTQAGISVSTPSANVTSNQQLMNEIVELKAMVRSLVDQVSSMEIKHHEEMQLISRENAELARELNFLKTFVVEKFSVDTNSLNSPDLPIVSKKPLRPVSQMELGSQNVASTSSTVFLPNPSSNPTICAASTSDRRVISISAACPKKWLSVSNLSPSTTAEDLVKHLHENLKIEEKVVSCTKITPRSIVNPCFVSFKVGIPEKFFQNMKSTNLWPPNVIVREFDNASAVRQSTRTTEKN